MVYEICYGSRCTQALTVLLVVIVIALQIILFNLEFISHTEKRPPPQIAKIKPTDALWDDPCEGGRSQESCEKLPDFLVIGPQKTGTKGNLIKLLSYEHMN